MNVLITGAKGFVGRNLVETLKTIRDGKKRDTNLTINEIYEYDKASNLESLKEYCKRCDFVFHLAGVNRPKNEVEFEAGNRDLTEILLNCLTDSDNKCPVMLSSSIQATQTGEYKGSLYGKSKAEAEGLVFRYAKDTGVKVFVYRFPNLFGKWCRPNYNSVVATFCNAFANQLPYQVSDSKKELELLYIDDLVAEMLSILRGQSHRCTYNGMNLVPAEEGEFCYVPCTHHVSLGEILDLLTTFDKEQDTLMFSGIPDHSFAKKLYSTFLSYLPPERTIFDLNPSLDERGSFTEFFKSGSYGQFSVNVSKPGIVKGEHWHHSKTEIFLVVSGQALIQERQIGEDDQGNPYPVREYRVSGEKLQCVRMLPGYTHNIINLSDTENLVTVMWANELFDRAHPETYHESVEGKTL